MQAGEGFRDKPITISCGRCMECRLAYARDWAVRMMHEASMHEANSFITLTYDNSNLPTNYGLKLTDWQKFAKRLRKAGFKFQFFHCGEYGEKTKRPHYHAALFGVDFSDDRIKYKQIKTHQYYTSATLTRIWGKGHCVIGDLTYETAAYVAGYITKKLYGERAEEEYQYVNEDGQVFQTLRPYCTMSRNPAIGLSWYNKFATDTYPRDGIVVDGKLCRPPKYYDRVHAELDPTGMQAIKAGRDHALRTSPHAKEALTFYKRRARYLAQLTKRTQHQREPGEANS